MSRTRRRRGASLPAFALALATLGLAAAIPRPAAATPLGTAASGPRVVRIPITVHLTTTSAGAVVDPARVGAWIAHANEVLAPHGIQLSLAAVRVLAPGFSVAASPWQRRRLGQHADDRGLHVFVVDRLDRPRPRGRTRVRGLWWNALRLGSSGARGRSVMLSSYATPETLAHEIGHALGLDHRRRPDNVMCSCDRRPDAAFDPLQGASLRAAARRHAR